MRELHLLLSSEHAGNQIPKRYRALFSGEEELLNSHRGFDPGALGVARAVAQKTGAPLFFTRISRLLVDANRSENHPALFSKFSRDCKELLPGYYFPYRERVAAGVAELVALGKRVLHVSVHSFTPILDGKVRMADVGLLYDPGRRNEREFCARWAERLKAEGFRVRRNYPYAGKSDSLTSSLRERYPEEDYLGIELELNHGIFYRERGKWAKLRAAVVRTLIDAMNGEQDG